MSTSFDEAFALMQTLVQYRTQPIASRLHEVRKARSMLHEDVLLLIYHLSKCATGNVLEIGPYLGGSTTAAALGTREAGMRRISVSVEPGGAYQHPRLPSKNILKDLRKNLAREGVAELVTIVEGFSGNDEVAAAVHRALPAASVGLLIIDADGGIERDFNLYRDLLMPNCSVVVDDYYDPKAAEGKAVTTKPQTDALVASGELQPLGLYGWGTWVGRWNGAR